MRNQTIPKLELMATLLLSRLIIRIKVEPSVCFNVDQAFCWSDSMVTLHWICSFGKHYGSFVQHRLTEIRSLVGHENWHFIDSGYKVCMLFFTLVNRYCINSATMY